MKKAEEHTPSLTDDQEHQPWRVTCSRTWSQIGLPSHAVYSAQRMPKPKNQLEKTRCGDAGCGGRKTKYKIRCTDPRPFTKNKWTMVRCAILCYCNHHSSRNSCCNCNYLATRPSACPRPASRPPTRPAISHHLIDEAISELICLFIQQSLLH